MKIKTKLIIILALIVTTLSILGITATKGILRSYKLAEFTSARLDTISATILLRSNINSQVKVLIEYITSGHDKDRLMVYELQKNSHAYIKQWNHAVEKELALGISKSTMVSKMRNFENNHTKFQHFIKKIIQAKQEDKSFDAFTIIFKGVGNNPLNIKMMKELNHLIEEEKEKLVDHYNELLTNFGVIPWISVSGRANVKAAKDSVNSFFAIDKTESLIVNQLSELMNYILSHDMEDKIITKELRVKTDLALSDWTYTLRRKLSPNNNAIENEIKEANHIGLTYSEIMQLANQAYIKIAIDPNSYIPEIENNIETIAKKVLFSLLTKAVNSSLEDAKAKNIILIKYTHKVRFIVTGIIMLVSLSIFFISISLINNIISSLSKLKNGTERIRSGNINQDFTLHTNDEFGEFSNSFNDMAKELYSSRQELISSKDYTDNVLNTMNDTLIVVTPDNWIKTVNETTCKLLGYQSNELIGQQLNMVLCDTPESNNSLFNRAKNNSIKNVEKVYQTKNKIKIDVLFSATIMYDNNGNTEGIVCVAQDITEHKKSAEALKESEERYALAAQGANDGIWDWKIKSNEMYYSPRWKYMLGYDEDEIENNPDEWFSRVNPKHINQLRAAIDAHIQGNTSYFQFEHQLLHKNGHYIWVVSRGLSVKDKGETAYRMSGSNKDITERKRIEEQLEHDIVHDSLTGMSNRLLFMERLKISMAFSTKNNKYLFAVLVLDLDRFKIINDSLGHIIGDQLLVSLAKRLNQVVHPGDTIARLGGDEFALILDDIGHTKDATRIAERIQQHLAAPFQFPDQEVFTTVSIGIALSTTGYTKPEEVLRDADTAMYRAKALGKNRYEMFDTKMHEAAVKTLNMEAEMRKAVDNEQFEVYYQPIVSLKTGKIVGAEALVRWFHPTKGSIPPDDFISIAEETGLIAPLGKWVLKTACHQNKIWSDNGFKNLTVAVNVSTRQFQQQPLLEIINQIIEETEIDPKNLEIEITESIAINDLDKNIAILNDISNMGIKISIDDFGTGYSSMGYLTRFPIHNIKIDRSFIQDIAIKPESKAIVSAVIAMTHSLNLKVIAEGVEKISQLNLLTSLKCNKIQGYFFSKPISSDDFLKMLKEDRTISKIIEHEENNDIIKISDSHNNHDRVKAV